MGLVHISIHGLLRALTNHPGDYKCLCNFNPRALTSPDRYLTAEGKDLSNFNPRALTSPDDSIKNKKRYWSFQSTGSYEP